MATPKVIGGYTWNRHVADARAGLRRARKILQVIVNERPGPTTMNTYLLELALAHEQVADALAELEAIGQKSTTPET